MCTFLGILLSKIISFIHKYVLNGVELPANYVTYPRKQTETSM